jgi:hypothetical protein
LFLFAIEKETRSPPFSPPSLKNTPVGYFSISASLTSKSPQKLISLLSARLNREQQPHNVLKTNSLKMKKVFHSTHIKVKLRAQL